LLEEETMKSLTLHALALGVLVGAWMLVMAYSGLYKHPTFNVLFYLVIAIEIAVLVSALQGGVKAGNGYVAQVARGSAVAGVGGVIVLSLSLIITAVLFPTFFAEVREMHASRLRGSGFTEVEIAARLNAEAWAQSPLASALISYVATVVTGLVSSAVIAVFVRSKS
jgi:hypothetical protein